MTLTDYWERRYATGGNSGAGSRGESAQAKAVFVNDVIVRYGVRSLVDWGCGDGHQAALLDIDDYLGIDISATAIAWCMAKMPHRQWLRLDPHTAIRVGVQAELALSMDVIFHLVDDDDYHTHLSALFTSAWRLVVIHSTDFDGEPNGHMRHRRFTGDIPAGWQRTSGDVDMFEPGFHLYERTT